MPCKLRVTSDCREDFGRATFGIVMYPIATDIPERRHSRRESPYGEPRRPDLVRLILGTYREMPGLHLTAPQAARLFGLRDVTCCVVLADLVRDGRIRYANGQYSAN